MSENNLHGLLGTSGELFHTPTGEAYASLDVTGHLETWSLGSKEICQLLERHLYRANGKMPSNKAVKDTLHDMTGQARFDGPELPVNLRVAGQDDAIFVDLSNDQWQSVKITPDGWKEMSNPPVKFRRTSNMRPLPIPEPGGSIDELRRFVNIGSDDDWILFTSYLVNMFRPDGPYPVLVINGQQGAAKSTLTRIIRALIDPNEAPIRTFPRSERDLFIGASKSWIQAFDNLSQLSAQNSDALCRLATGGSFAIRKLFTDDDEAVFNATRPVILNGIEALATRGDLLDRSIILQLPTLSETERQDERTLWKEFEAARPRILGALLDGVSIALRNQDDVVLAKRPRMADFATRSCAAAPAFGWTPEDFMDAYEQNIGSANDVVLEASPVAQSVLNLMDNQPVWKGTATQLLTALLPYFEGMPKCEYPSTAQKLSNTLRRLNPNIRKAGVDMIFDERKPGTNRDRMITLRKGPGDHPLPPEPPTGQENWEPEVPLADLFMSTGQLAHEGEPALR